MAQRYRWHLGSSETWVRSLAPAWLSELRIWHCCGCGLDLIPGPELHVPQGGQKEKKVGQLKIFIVHSQKQLLEFPSWRSG